MNLWRLALRRNLVLVQSKIYLAMSIHVQSLFALKQTNVVFCRLGVIGFVFERCFLPKFQDQKIRLNNDVDDEPISFAIGRKIR